MITKNGLLQKIDNRKSKFAVGVLTLLVIISLWELISFAEVYNIVLFPPPHQIVKAFLQMIMNGQWTNDLKSSLFRYGVGYILGNLIGIVLGILTAKIKIFRASVGPVLNYLRSTPSVALIPLAIVWFGIGDMQKIFIVTWGVTFPVWLNAHAGISEVQMQYVWAAKSLGAKDWQLYKEVYFPGALPYIITGARMGIATAFFALAAAEMAGAFSGVGFRIFHSHQMFQTDKMMVAILTIGLLGIVFDSLFVRIMRRLLPWWVEDRVRL